MKQSTSSEADLRRALRDNRTETFGDLSLQHRPFLRKLVQMRMDRRLRARIDPSDIIQITLFEASRRLDEYLDNPKVSFRRWLAYLAEQNTVAAFRQHMQAKKRSASREQSATPSAHVDGVIPELAELLVSDITDPAISVARLERRERLYERLSSMREEDQQIVHLRFFLGLSHSEIAETLNITRDAAAQRGHRALKRLMLITSDLGLESTAT